MMTIDTTEMKNAIKTSTAFQDFGIKRMTVEGFKIYRETDESVSYQVAIRHKVLDNEDNASVYQVTKYNDGTMHAYFNGTFRVAKDGTLESCWDVHYGGFTNEMAREWLSALFNGDDPARQDEVEEELSEAPVEPETPKMNDFMKQEVLLNVDRLKEAQQKVVCIEEYVDEAYDATGDMIASYHFDGVPEDFEKKVKEYRSRLCDIHNEIYHLYSEMAETCQEVRKQVERS